MADDAHLKRIEQAFSHARIELDGIESVGPQVRRRIDNMTITPASSRVARAALMTLAILALGAIAWWQFGKQAFVNVAQATATDFRLEVGGADLVTHVSALVDGRAVLVIWSFDGKSLAPAGSDNEQERIGNYQCSVLREEKPADGRTTVWSLFIPDPNVHPMLEPPLIRAVWANSEILAFSTTPRVTSTDQLANVIHSAGIALNDRGAMDEVLGQISRKTH